MVNRTSSGQEYRSSVTGKLRFVFLSFLTLLVVALAACGGTSSTITGTPTPQPSTGAWPQANYDYSNTRNTSESSITEQNVNQLGVAWNVPVSGVSAFGALATSPVVANGVVYWQDLQSNVYAVDLQTGKLKWTKMYNALSIGPNGVALDNNKLFVVSSETSIAALDAATGNEIWTWQDPQPKLQGIDQQVTVYNGTVYTSTVPGIGVTSFYQGGQVGVLYALDEQTGNVKWSFNTVKDGNLWGNPQVNSGGGAWYPPAIDPATGTTYWGIGNPAPYPGTKQYPNGSSRPGDNLYTDSELAISSTGQLLWYKQVKAHDLFDADFETSPILTTATVNGAQKKIVIGAGKLGYAVAFDAQTGDILWKTSVGKHQNDDTQQIPAGQSIAVYPGTYGGVETPLALADNVIYVPVINMSTNYTSSGLKPNASFSGTGELNAIDINTGKILWTATFPAIDVGGATVVGNLVFTSTYDGKVFGLDRASGKQIWSWQAPGSINSPLTVVGDTMLVPVGIGKSPAMVALKLGAK
jgi:glucose dehydrogenase